MGNSKSIVEEQPGTTTDDSLASTSSESDVSTKVVVRRNSSCLPRRPSNRPGCAIMLRNVGVTVMVKRKDVASQSLTSSWPFDELDEEIGAPEEEIGTPPPQCKATSSTQKRYVEKVILRNVTGVLQPGLNAVMGPSGGGKTTFLDTISKRKTEGIVVGDVFLDDKPATLSLIKKVTSYVLQFDCFYGGSTVYETILFCTMIKIPDVEKIPRTENYQAVEDVIRATRLENCRNIFIGNHLVRGISGGDKKQFPLRVLCCCSNAASYSTNRRVVWILRWLAKSLFP